jgi:tetratricopeptide (TPR) repeat protein
LKKLGRLISTPAEEALSRAQEALSDGNLTEAISAFEDAREAGASLRQTAERHALALSDLGRHAEAVEVLKPWFAKNRKSYPVVNLMGVLLKRAGRFSKAVQVLEQARKLKPGVVSAWQNLGNAYEAMGDLEAAAKAFRRGLRADPKSPRGSTMEATKRDDRGRQRRDQLAGRLIVRPGAAITSTPGRR